MNIRLGAIADDFTGATDLANILVKNGMKTTLVFGVPETHMNLSDNPEAVIIALKSRTIPVQEAVDQSLKALEWFMVKNTEQIFFKYCSTFDSTEEGNIGPVADALADKLNADFVPICPAFPENGRTVYQGHLFVGDQLLSDSPMKDHPLTPMRESDICKLMQKQSRYQTGLIPLQIIRKGTDAICKRIEELKKQDIRYGIIDIVSDEDLENLGSAFSDRRLLTGGSAFGMVPARNLKNSEEKKRETQFAESLPEGRAVVLAGSCSAMTRKQINFAKKIWPARKINAEDLFSGKNLIDEVKTWIESQTENSPAIVYASSDPKDVESIQKKYGVAESGALIENFIGTLAGELAKNGFNRFIIAGGETSGAVVSALGIQALEVGMEIAPGVPWTKSRQNPESVFALKSGNFGSENFFIKALEVINERK